MAVSFDVVRGQQGDLGPREQILIFLGFCGLSAGVSPLHLCPLIPQDTSASRLLESQRASGLSDPERGMKGGRSNPLQQDHSTLFLPF